MKHVISAILLGFAFLCGGAVAQEADCSIPVQGGYFPEYEKRNTVVVFVHGFRGNAIDTWTHSSWLPWSSKVFFPCLVLGSTRSEPIFKDVNVYLFDHPAGLYAGSPKVEAIAERLYRHLESAKVFAHDNVTFVAHSLGGLVIARMLTGPWMPPAHQQRVRLVQFYGTPAGGAGLANLAAPLSGSLADIADIQVVGNLLKGWHARPKQIQAVCYAEDTPVVLSPVVDAASAAVLCGGKATVLPGDGHSDMVKPKSIGAWSFGGFFDQFVRCVKPHMSPPSPPLPAGGALPANQLLSRLVQAFSQPAAQREAALRAVTFNPKVNFPPNYVAPRTQATGIGIEHNELVALSDFDRSVRERLAGLLAAPRPIGALFELRQLAAYFEDHRAVSLRERLLLNGFSATDVVIVLADSAYAERIVLVASAHDPGSPELRLRGFMLLEAGTPSCTA